MNSIDYTAALWNFFRLDHESIAADTQRNVEQVVKALAPAVPVQFSINPTGEMS